MSLVALAVALSLATSPTLAAADLSPYQWNNRVLVIFADPAAPEFAQQAALIERNADALADRDLLVLAVQGDTVTTLFGTADTLDADALRARLDPSMAPFEVVLVGKDGGVKLRRTAPVTANELFDLIDSMPMRAVEMGRQQC